MAIPVVLIGGEEISKKIKNVLTCGNKHAIFTLKEIKKYKSYKMRQPNKSGRTTVQIDYARWRALKTYADESGRKLYAVIDDVLDSGMKRKRIMPDGEGTGTSATDVEV